MKKLSIKFFVYYINHPSFPSHKTRSSFYALKTFRQWFVLHKNWHKHDNLFYTFNDWTIQSLGVLKFSWLNCRFFTRNEKSRFFLGGGGQKWPQKNLETPKKYPENKLSICLKWPWNSHSKAPQGACLPPTYLLLASLIKEGFKQAQNLSIGA